MADVSQLEVNGTTYDICDATARDSLSNYVLKTGDTMTGTLNGTSAIFSGDVSGDNATFSGDVSGDNATFSGDVNADGDIVALGEVQAAERLVVNANENNYGAIRFNSENAAYDGVRFYGGDDEYGDEMAVGAGGRLIAGSGESAYNLHNALIDAGETPGNEQTYIASDGRLYLFSHCGTIENRTQLMLNNSSYVDLYGRCGADHEVNIGPSADNGATGTVASIGKIEFQDKNGTWSSSIGSEVNGSTGTVRTFFGLHNVKTDGTNASNWLCIDLKKDGTVAYSIPYYANFRSAIWAACKPTQLYNNATGTNGTVALSASAANYNYLRIYFRGYPSSGGYNKHASIDVYSPNGKYVALSTSAPMNSNSSAVDIQSKVAYITGSSIQSTRATSGNVRENAYSGVYNEIYIVRVEGWND